MVSAILALCFLQISPVANADDSVYPFQRVPRKTLIESKYKVVAHWHNYPIRYYNTPTETDMYSQFLNPFGRPFDKYYLDIGGRLRSRPIPQTYVSDDKQYLLKDMELDITNAADIGVDAFLTNIWFGPEDNRWNNVLITSFSAAEKYNSTHPTTPFKIAVNVDALIIYRQIKNAGKLNDTAYINNLGSIYGDRVAMVANRSAYFKHNNRHVVGFFAPNFLPKSFFSSMQARLAKNKINNPYFVFFYNGETLQKKQSLLSLTGATGHWWSGTYTSKNPQEPARTWAKNNGLPYVQAVNFSDCRPAAQRCFETGGFKYLVNTMETAIAGNADWIQLQTWNDHGEGHAMRPNTISQYAPADVAAYYIQYFKTRKRPTITKDAIYYSHRMHLAKEVPLRQKQNLLAYQNGTPYVDKVFSLSFLKKGATVQITSDGRAYTHSFKDADVTNGPVFWEAPLAENDQPRFQIQRPGSPSVNLLSAFKTRSKIDYQDLEYRAGGSLRPPIPGVQNNLPEDRVK